MSKADLPPNWKLKRLGDLASTIQYGYTAKAQQEKVGPRMLRISDIQDGTVSWDAVPFCNIDESDKAKYLLSNGDLVFARTGATVGKSFLIRGSVPETVFASYLIRVRLRENIDPNYVSYFFKSPQYWQQISENQAGIGQPNVNGKKLSELLVPVAPPTQQKKIVAEIDKQFSRLDEAVANLKRVKANLKRYKAAVLKAAVEGKLTEDWRKQHPDVEPASELLKRILAERRAKWNGKAKYKEPKPADTAGLPLLPQDWVWSTVGELSFLDSGEAFKKRDYSDSGLKLFQIANVGFGQSLWEQQNFLPESFRERYSDLILEVGDIVVALNRPILGKQLKIARITERDQPAILYQRVGRLKPVACEVAPYLFYFGQSESMIKSVRERLQGTDQPYLNTSLVPDIAVPLPPLFEQERIVAEVEQRLSVIEKLELQLNADLQRAERFRQSILSRAFEGKVLSSFSK